jgi:hypothetical protein
MGVMGPDGMSRFTFFWVLFLSIHQRRRRHHMSKIRLPNWISYLVEGLTFAETEFFPRRIFDVFEKSNFF